MNDKGKIVLVGRFAAQKFSIKEIHIKGSGVYFSGGIGYGIRMLRYGGNFFFCFIEQERTYKVE